MYETDTSVVEELKEAILTVENQSILVTLKHLKKGTVQDLIFGAGLNKYFIRGLRTNSCTADFHVAPHFIQYHSNPRDLWPQAEAWEEPVSETGSVNAETDTNYL
ncbi:hypothetical protein MXB_5561 [Myxobolus squamalis]|nr:hypothetical protein MXB_5561 [Myxobolus squamalis]